MTEYRKIIFSFDDGPHPIKALNDICTVLRKSAIKAEFYVRGDEAEKYRDAVRMIAGQGHKVQNHSWSHPNLAKASEDEVRSQLERTQKIIKEITGVMPTKVRPPYGAGGWPKKYDPELLKVAQSLSLSIHNWDIDTEDWKTPKGIGPTKIENIEKQLKFRNKGKRMLNVLMHVQNETARDLPDFIKYLKESGFTFSAPLG
ncbi:polysaccharide deacetylase family protein [Candidatus Thiosymbion oneisti]|uniref:polysaccharide deacetylase family protein n=1 Tax=Candidatus Thiosymbion oneisti TaxID=589554 RepID=UPI001A9C3025|nr:polysaccharide deacetylase family protein [Candidatus Thiosymbion oneisti]